ncbi:MAG: ABC transporter permease, partial [Bacillota bacterium]|nr:ABC transporter permease [Bacillota bacterium]
FWEVKEMTFEAIVVKNFKHHLKKYLSYFMCSSFSIMIFFMYSALFFNGNLNQDEGFKLVFSTGLFSISLFALFFVSYAHSAFIKSRYKEFGVYMALGMSDRHIRKLILFENVLVILFSVLLGLCTGLLFSRLFQMVALELLGIENFSYSLNYKSFALTLGIFSAIFLFVILRSSLSLRKLDIAGLFQKARRVENHKRFSLVLGLIGLLAVFSSFFVLLFAYNNRDLKIFDAAALLSLAFAFGGIYLVISNLGNGLLQFIKVRPDLYYRNLLTASEINQKFQQNKKVLLVLSILSTMIILFLGMTFSMYSHSKKMSELLQPNHLEYIELGTVNRLSPESLNTVFQGSKTPLSGQRGTEFLSLNIKDDTDPSDLLKSKPFVSESAYNGATHGNLKVENGEAVGIIIPGSQVMTNYAPQFGRLELEVMTGSYELNCSMVLHAVWISGLGLYPSKAGIVISDSDYAAIRKNISPEQIGQYRSYTFQDWEKTKDTVARLKEFLENSNKGAEESNVKLFGTASTFEFYEAFRQNYSLAVFILGMIGILFFIASITVLYFKQFTDLPGAREKFFKLYKVGITDKEIVQAVSKEMRLIFFLPLILAVIPGLSTIWFSNSMLGGEDIMDRLMLSAGSVIGLYFLLQAVLYSLIKRAYCLQILS